MLRARSELNRSDQRRRCVGVNRQFQRQTASARLPQSIIKGDFNNDAKLDIAVSLNAPNQVGVFLGNGDGTFGQMTKIPTNSGGTPTSLVAADFNLNGRLDLMTSDQIDCSGPCQAASEFD